jgi:biotin carboxyl carrier protein
MYSVSAQGTATVVSIDVAVGEVIKAGTVVAVLNQMKVHFMIHAHALFS